MNAGNNSKRIIWQNFFAFSSLSIFHFFLQFVILLLDFDFFFINYLPIHRCLACSCITCSLYYILSELHKMVLVFEIADRLQRFVLSPLISLRISLSFSVLALLLVFYWFLAVLEKVQLVEFNFGFLMIIVENDDNFFIIQLY